MVVECELKVGWTIVKSRMRSEEEIVGQYEVLGRICWKDCSETRGKSSSLLAAFSKSKWIIRASFKARSFLKYGEARALGIVSTTQRTRTVGQLETIKLGKDKELVELRLKLIYISRNGHKSNSKNSTLFLWQSHNILAYFRRFSLTKPVSNMKGVNVERGNSFRNFFDETEDERDESAKACVDRDPRDFTVHRSSYKAPSTPGFFQQANEPKGSGAREKKKEQLRSRREMARLNASDKNHAGNYIRSRVNPDEVRKRVEITSKCGVTLHEVEELPTHLSTFVQSSLHNSG
ncbi:hypothetical protein ALC57_07151 [Trachymyrmex cornetzi]|uniref:Uncharacterized protein n=1 Tax=Trachymyrmex cornetzi TaxID=471704 RepID=A0A195E5T2_9HYME|nr:hypothetical protein ALC57_07151 [Trachymyrmex cornetzi]